MTYEDGYRPVRHSVCGGMMWSIGPCPTCDPAGYDRMLAEIEEDNRRISEPPAFTGTVDDLEAWLADLDLEIAERRAVVLDHVRLDRLGGRPWDCVCPWCVVARRDVATRALARPQTEAERRRAAEIERRRAAEIDDAEAGDDLLRAAGVEIVA